MCNCHLAGRICTPLCPCFCHGGTIGGTRAGKTYLSALLVAGLLGAEGAARRYAERVAAEDAATAAEGRPAESIPGEVLAREDAPPRRPASRTRPISARLSPWPSSPSPPR